MILVPSNKIEKINYFSTLLGLIFIEITRGPLPKCNHKCCMGYKQTLILFKIHAEIVENNTFLGQTSNFCHFLKKPQVAVQNVV